MNNKKNIIIAGCGGIGSLVAFNIALRNEELNDVNELVLIDKDILEEKNLPYVFMGIELLRGFINKPKVYALANLLNSKLQMNFKVKIRAINKSVEDFVKDYYKYYTNNKIFIDCRDINTCSEIFDAKICCDGCFGRLIINPTCFNDDNGFTRYVYGFSLYYALKFSNICVDTILNNKFETGVYVMNFKAGLNFENITNVKEFVNG